MYWPSHTSVRLLKSDPILLILKSELDVPILKIDKFAFTLLRFIRADFLLLEKCVNDLSCDTVVVRCLQSHNNDSSEPILLLEKCVNDLSCDTVVVRCLQSHYNDLSEPIILLEKCVKKISCDFSKIGTDLLTGSQIITEFFLVGSDFVFGLKIGSDDRTMKKSGPICRFKNRAIVGLYCDWGIYDINPVPIF